MSNISLGQAGELVVVDYVQQHGFVVIAQNYRKFFGEIDIIAHKKNLYIFVEVKTRRPTTVAMGNLISLSKQQKIIKTALTFIAEQKITESTFRFDVALVHQVNNQFEIEYIENAFTKHEYGYHE